MEFDAPEAFFENTQRDPLLSEFDMADDFKQFTSGEQVDQPKPQERKAVRTKSTLEVANEISHKKITSKI